MTTGSIGGGAAAVPGANKQVIYNDSGVLAGDSGLTYDKTTDEVTFRPSGGAVATKAENYSASGNSAEHNFYKSRHTTPGSHTVVQNGDFLGIIRFDASDGSAFRDAAAITGQVRGTPAANRTGGALGFWTTPDTVSGALTYRGGVEADGTMLLNGLAGTGSRAVQADASGVLSAVRAGMADLLHTATFASVASYSLPASTFSANYPNYRLIYRYTTSANAANVNLRMRAAGVDDAGTSQYVVAGYYVSVAGAASGNLQTAATFFQIGWGTASNVLIQRNIVLDVMYPFVAERTNIAGMETGLRNGFDWMSQYFGGSHGVSAAYDSMTIFPSSGLISGAVWVYGYR